MLNQTISLSTLNQPIPLRINERIKGVKSAFSIQDFLPAYLIKDVKLSMFN